MPDDPNTEQAEQPVERAVQTASVTEAATAKDAPSSSNVTGQYHMALIVEFEY